MIKTDFYRQYVEERMAVSCRLCLVVVVLMLSAIASGLKAQTAGAASMPQRVDNASAGYFCNPPLPWLPYKLDVLFIGNSFSIDTSSALPTIFRNMGLTTVNVFVLYKGGCSMRQHCEYFLSDEPVYELWQYNIDGEKRLERKTTIRDVMARYPYDIVVFQQYSLESGQYETYEPYVARLIQAFKLVTTSPRTTFAFNQTWAYSSRHADLARVYGSQENMWQRICSATRLMRQQSGIDVIIPCGTAVQNARNLKSVTTSNEWTRDNQHISLYQGRYLLACTFFEAVISPCLGISIADDHSRLGRNADEMVDDATRPLIQRCARMAVANNYAISDFVNWEP